MTDVVRSKDSEIIESITTQYPEYFTFDCQSWLDDDHNYAYLYGENVGFAEYKRPGFYRVHFCLHSARGREAIEVTKWLLNRLYRDTEFSSIVGLIYHDNKSARWLIRQVGFESDGMIETEIGVCELFYMTSQRNGRNEFLFA